MMYRTTQDIVIPAGTELDAAPSRINYFAPHAMGVIGHGRDHTSYWTIDLEEAQKLGLVEEVISMGKKKGGRKC